MVLGNFGTDLEDLITRCKTIDFNPSGWVFKSSAILLLLIFVAVLLFLVSEWAAALVAYNKDFAITAEKCDAGGEIRGVSLN